VLPPRVLRTMVPGDVPSLRFLAALGGDDLVYNHLGRTWGDARGFFRGWAVGESCMVATIAKGIPNLP
jgi:hypothetical protein